MHIAIATDRTIPELPGGEALLIPQLSNLGIEASVVTWNDKPVDWSIFDAVIIRSCWGYFQQIEHFTAWLDELERHGVPVYNDPQIIRWNAHKKYLLDLQKRGVAIPSTTLVRQGDTRHLDQLIDHISGQDCIVKPCYGADAFGVCKFKKSNAQSHEGDFQKLLGQSDVLVQAFVPEISTGELSAVFFGNRFSHAVIKRPAHDEFRVNHDFGGDTMPYTPSPELVTDLEEIYRMCQVDTLYARVDVVVTENGPKLMELELIEPYLYLETSPDAPQRFAEACVKLRTKNRR